uniref:SAM domain-containing protein n=1 Tax=Panagrolaimus sp. JU765 TaxID=591449 RepID=A0AC34QEM9_9BILA
MEIAPEIDEIFYKFLERQDLHKFAPILVEESVTRVEHLEYVTDNELASYGLSSPAIRRLRAALLNHFNVDKASPSEPTTPQPLPRKKYSVSQELPPDEPIHKNSMTLQIQTIDEKDVSYKRIIFREA